jgi:hypothetical protein
MFIILFFHIFVLNINFSHFCLLHFGWFFTISSGHPAWVFAATHFNAFQLSKPASKSQHSHLFFYIFYILIYFLYFWHSRLFLLYFCHSYLFFIVVPMPFYFSVKSINNQFNFYTIAIFSLKPGFELCPWVGRATTVPWRQWNIRNYIISFLTTL